MSTHIYKPLRLLVAYCMASVCYEHPHLCVTAPQLKVSEDRLSVTGEKGYSMIRATYGEYQFVHSRAVYSPES